MKQITVALKDHPYKIIFSKNPQDFISSLKKIKGIMSLFIVCDKNTAAIYLKDLEAALIGAGFKVKSAVIAAGESAKCLKTLSFLYERGLSENLDRKSCVIALGGGVTGDLAGFFASTYMRGIKLVQIPTTLLAMCDSSVGGKTAVNLKGGKNTAGTFYQPSLVWVNIDFLKTLPIRHIKNAFAEIIKYALAFDKDFFAFLSSAFFAKSKLSETELYKGFISQRNFIEKIIYKSLLYKASVIEKDEKETKKLREILNLGHTLAHGIETYTQYKKYLHGEAVALGLLFAAQLSAMQKRGANAVYSQTKSILSAAKLLPKKMPSFELKKLLSIMKKDKKNAGESIYFVLLKSLGKAEAGHFICDDIVLKEMEKFFRSF
ncbi:MAG: 3-dehydroquinate synthase [Elusimicrobiota bacterium]|jgi:3-dehydroquinate synthase|nr:3-dehydroquinate synthase [Elusimicrobiota bacterium]